MKFHKLIATSLVTAVLMGSTLAVWADKKREFGFSGKVDAVDRGNGTMVVEDMLFRIDNNTQIVKKRGRKGTLADLRPGITIGFYPSGSGRRAQSSVVERVWILPRNWRAEPGYAETPDN